MARIRTIKPEFCTSERVIECSRDARLLFILLWPFCDDGGVHPASLKVIKAETFPADDDVSVSMIAGWLDELLRAGLIRRFAHDGRQYLHVSGWKQHQRIDKPQPLRYPAPDTDGVQVVHAMFSDEAPQQRSGAATGALPDHSCSAPVAVPPPLQREGRKEGGEGIGEEGKGASLRSVGDADATKGPGMDDLFERFWSAYPSRGSHANPKKPARQKFEAAVKRGADPEGIISGAENYAKQVRAAGRERTEHVAQAQTFLNQERWRDLLDTDEIEPWRADPKAWRDATKPPPWPDAPTGTQCGPWRKTGSTWAFMR